MMVEAVRGEHDLLRYICLWGWWLWRWLPWAWFKDVNRMMRWYKTRGKHLRKMAAVRTNYVICCGGDGPDESDNTSVWNVGVVVKWRCREIKIEICGDEDLRNGVCGEGRVRVRKGVWNLNDDDDSRLEEASVITTNDVLSFMTELSV